MTPEELSAIEQRANAATPGPWEFDGDCTIDGGGAVCHMAEHKSHHTFARTGEWYSSADAAFIANARTDIPALIAYIRELEQLVAAFREGRR